MTSESVEEWDSEEEELGFVLKIDTLLGVPIHVFAYPLDTLELLKTRISFQEGIPTSEQTILVGQTVLNDPYRSLADLGLTEESNVRLITSISTGVPYAKGFRDSSPPIHLSISDRSSSSSSSAQTSSRVPVKNLQKPCSQFPQGQRLRDDSPKEQTSSISFPKLPEPTDEESRNDGLLVLQDRFDRRLFLIIKKGLAPGDQRKESVEDLEEQELEYLRRLQSKANISLRSLGNKTAEVTNDSYNKKKSARSARADQLDRIRENAKTLQKMNQIRQNLLQRKQVEEEPLELPNIVVDKTPPVTLKRPGSTTPSKKPTTPHPNNLAVNPSVATLNRLKAELYLQSKRKDYLAGQLPYSQDQLCKYVQLSVAILLAQQEGKDSARRANRFTRATKSYTLIPSVVKCRNWRTGAASSKSKENTGILDTTFGLSSPSSESSTHTLNSTRRIRPLSSQLLLSRPATASSMHKLKKKGTGVRCEECRKRIGPAGQFTCRCGDTFCTIHRIPEAHKCTFDYKAEGRRILRETNPVILPTKVTEI